MPSVEAGPPPIRVLLVEDNDVFRQALILLLELQDGIEVVGAVSEGDRAVAACREHRPARLRDGLPAAGHGRGRDDDRALTEACPDVAVVCLTASASPRELEALTAAGAVDCLRKDQPLEEIVGRDPQGG